MAVEYNFEINTHVDERVVAQVLITQANFMELQGSLIGHDLWVRVGKVLEPDDDMTRGLLGALPNINILFRQQPRDHGYEQAEVHMARAVAILLARFPGNCMLLYNGENVQLERINNVVRVDEAEFELRDLWSNSLSRHGIAFQRAQLAQPFL